MGSATTGAGQPFPIEADPTDIETRDDGAIGLAYTYGAAGSVAGSVPGHFTYQEHGRIYFMNPADPTTQTGSDLHSATFSLLPSNSDHGGLILISDTCHECYENGHESARLSELPQWARNFAVESLLTGDSGASSDPVVNYGYFPFTNEHGTFKGYATLDFRKFVISVVFDHTDGAEGE
jgi:hypothetical protein